MVKVFSLPLNLFRKTARCPSSQDVLKFAESACGTPLRYSIEAHVADCDFCRAELQMLKRHRAEPCEIAAGEIPTSLRRLAEAMLPKPSPLRCGTIV